jgi:hypothetical protein
MLRCRPVYDKGQHTLQVPMSMFADNRARLLARLRKVAGVTGSSVVLLQGGDTHNVYCTDAEDVFRQVSHRSHLFHLFFYSLLMQKCVSLRTAIYRVNTTNQRCAVCALLQVNKSMEIKALSQWVLYERSNRGIYRREDGECHCTVRKLICKHAHCSVFDSVQ